MVYLTGRALTDGIQRAEVVPDAVAIPWIPESVWVILRHRGGRESFSVRHRHEICTSWAEAVRRAELLRIARVAELRAELEHVEQLRFDPPDSD